MNKGFIAYVGSEIDENEIKNILASISVERNDEGNEHYKPYVKSIGAIFGQVNDSDIDTEYCLPYLYDNNMLYVASYNYYDFQNIAYDFNEDDYDFDDNTYHRLIPLLMKDYDEVAFKILEKKGLDCAWAGYNEKTSDFIVAKIGDIELYYGYTKQNHEIIFSDYASAILELCGSVYKFPDSSFYKNGSFHTFKKKQEEIKYENPEVFDEKLEQKKKFII